MFGNLIELLGFTSLTLGAYELAGRGVALIVLAGALFILALAAEGLKPVQALRATARGLWWRVKLRAALLRR